MVSLKVIFNTESCYTKVNRLISNEDLFDWLLRGVGIISFKRAKPCCIRSLYGIKIWSYMKQCSYWIQFHRKDFSWLKQNNKCNARDQASDFVLRKLLCVKYLRRQVIDNHSRDLQASNCARESIKPARATRSKRQLLTNLRSRHAAARRRTVTKRTAIIQADCHYTERGTLTREGLSNLV